MQIYASECSTTSCLSSIWWSLGRNLDCLQMSQSCTRHNDWQQGGNRCSLIPFWTPSILPHSKGSFTPEVKWREASGGKRNKEWGFRQAKWCLFLGLSFSLLNVIPFRALLRRHRKLNSSWKRFSHQRSILPWGLSEVIFPTKVNKMPPIV